MSSARRAGSLCERMFEPEMRGLIPVGCSDLAASGRWVVEDCCPDCHGGRGRCRELLVAVVFAEPAIEVEVCCALLEQLDPAWRRLPEAQREVA